MRENAADMADRPTTRPSRGCDGVGVRVSAHLREAALCCSQTIVNFTPYIHSYIARSAVWGALLTHSHAASRSRTCT